VETKGTNRYACGGQQFVLVDDPGPGAAEEGSPEPSPLKESPDFSPAAGCS